MIQKASRLLIICMAVVLVACQNNGHTPVQGTSITLRYAQNLTLTQADGYVQAVLRNPWDTTAVLQTYLLVPREQDLPSSLPPGIVIRTPLQKTLVYSSVHCQLIHDLGFISAIAGVCDPEYIKLADIQQGLTQGTIANCGSNTAPNIEAIAQLAPEAVLLSPYQDSGDYGKLGKLGIPLILCADYMETSPLGRAEWMRFYSLLFGSEETANRRFDEVEQHYLELKAKVQQATEHPRVLSDTRYGQVWYVPGSQSTIGQLYHDAQGINPFESLQQAGSVALSPEQVLNQAHDADIWLIKYNQPQPLTLEQIAGMDAIYTQFKAFQHGEVWGCNTTGSNYYEEVPFHPDFLLEDLIRILHPTCLPESPIRYYQKLE